MGIAVFDLDGTITRHDTLTPFVLGWLSRRPWTVLKLVAVLPGVLSFVFHRDRGRLKERLIRATLRGARRDALAQWADEFVAITVRDRTFAAARAAISQHRDNGDRLVLMSASVDLYVPRIARALGFHETICTGVRWTGDVLDGALTTANRRGEEKARCLRELMARAPAESFTAYGNTTSDLAHLRLASKGVFVNGSPRVVAAVRQLGIECRRWR
jgi:phosphatidylglycerophosphatase C